MTPQRYRKFRAVLEKRQPDLTVIADHIHKGRNMAAIRRTCDAMGVPKMHAILPEGFEQKRFAGTTQGTHKWVELVKHRSLESCLDEVKGQGMQLCVADLSAQSVDYREVDFTQPTAILMGAEIVGPSEQAKARADIHFHVPMLGLVESLNVSVACALILDEAIRQRQSKGMLDTPSMSESEMKRLAFEWGYPKLKRYYQWKQLPYPDMDDEGQLID
jgi:tRNA (guanosine-2'-O-)-methyltransferase